MADIVLQSHTYTVPLTKHTHKHPHAQAHIKIIQSNDVMSVTATAFFRGSARRKFIISCALYGKNFDERERKTKPR